MTHGIDPDDLRRYGFQWPKYAIIEQRLNSAADPIHLSALKQSLYTDLIYYEQQLQEAYAFKHQIGADYSDFTDRYDEYAERYRQLQQAVR
ncbi:MAG: hypothetical protein KatS3mg057_1534 [Herpetosiphonaceae bacterium]|nr:MAG: hypothetical protein KatS3mg057_1534 [Herpetosiphonaceae bacterium]